MKWITIIHDWAFSVTRSDFSGWGKMFFRGAKNGQIKQHQEAKSQFKTGSIHGLRDKSGLMLLSR